MSERINKQSRLNKIEREYLIGFESQIEKFWEYVDELSKSGECEPLYFFEFVLFLKKNPRFANLLREIRQDEFEQILSDRRFAHYQKTEHAPGAPIPDPYSYSGTMEPYIDPEYETKVRAILATLSNDKDFQDKLPRRKIRRPGDVPPGFADSQPFPYGREDEVEWVDCISKKHEVELAAKTRGIKPPDEGDIFTTFKRNAARLNKTLPENEKSVHHDRDSKRMWYWKKHKEELGRLHNAGRPRKG